MAEIAKRRPDAMGADAAPSRSSPARNIPASTSSARPPTSAAAKLGLELSYFPYTAASLPARDFGELDKIFRAIVEDRCDALVVFPDVAMYEVSDRIARFASEAKLPSVSGWSPIAGTDC